METPDYFARVPYALYDARRQNVITSLQFDIMTILHRWANWHTGVVRTCSAERLQRAMGDLEKPPSERTIQRHMQGLHEAGWFFSHYRKGSKKPYAVDLNNYMPVADGDAEMALIRPTTIMDWEETKACRVADEGGREDAEGTLKGRSKGGLKEIVPEISDKISSEISSKETSASSEVNDRVSEGASRLGSSDHSDLSSQDIQELLSREDGLEPEVIKYVLSTIGLVPNQALIDSIFVCHPEFIWDVDDAAQAAIRVLSTKFWKKAIKTLENFRYYWSKEGEGDLCAQIKRELPDPRPAPPQPPTYKGSLLSDGTVRCHHCESIFADEPSWKRHTETIWSDETKGYLDGEIDTEDVEPLTPPARHDPPTPVAPPAPYVPPPQCKWAGVDGKDPRCTAAPVGDLFCEEHSFRYDFATRHDIDLTYYDKFLKTVST